MDGDGKGKGGWHIFLMGWKGKGGRSARETLVVHHACLPGFAWLILLILVVVGSRLVMGGYGGVGKWIFVGVLGLFFPRSTLSAVWVCQCWCLFHCDGPLVVVVLGSR